MYVHLNCCLFIAFSSLVFTKPIKGEEAKELKELCPMNVFDIEDASKKIKKRRVTHCACGYAIIMHAL